MTFKDANDLAVLQAGANAEWSVQLGPTSAPPADLAGGSDMKGALVALVKIDPRENIGYRTVRVTAAAFDVADTYTITLDGVVHAVVTPATLDALVEAWEASINGGSHTGVLTALSVNDDDVDDPGSNTRVWITGDTDTDYVLDVSRTGGGSGTIDATADASNCTARLYALNSPAAIAATWTEVRWPKTDLVDLPVGEHGFEERLEVASIPRMHVELDDVFGDYDGIPGAGATLTYSTRVLWGPSVLGAS